VNRILPFVAVAIVVLANGCFGPKPSDIIASYQLDDSPPEFGQGIAGYNKPSLDAYNRGVGMRAVVSGRLLHISIDNQSTEPLYIEPRSFAILLSEVRKPYVFSAEQGDLLGAFPTDTLLPGGRNLYSVGVAAGVSNPISGRALVLQYPPLDLIHRVEIEPVSELLN